MRFTGFMGGLLLAALPKLLAAQPALPPPRPVRDSAFAVHQLFKKRRLAAEGALGTGAAGVVGVVASAARGNSALAGADALIAVVSTGVGLRQALRYSPEHERFIVQQYERGWPLPPEVRQCLKPKYFRGQ